MPISSALDLRRATILLAAASMALIPAAPAAAIVRTTLNFFSATNLQQGQIGAQGQILDGGELIDVASRSCCFAVTAAAAGGAPSQVLRTFSQFETIDQIYYMGVTPDRDHLVFALNTAFSTSIAGREFTTITAFSGFTESGLISDLFGQFDQSLTVDQRVAAGDRLGVFQSQLFDANAGFGVTDAFALTSFSIGTPAGTGFSQLRAPPGAVPEPSSWAMLILGFGLTGASLRYRRPVRAGSASLPA